MACVASLPALEMRVFPERYVVCVSCPEDASAHHGNPSLAAVSAVYTPLFPLAVAWQNSCMGLWVIIGMRCQIVRLLYICRSSVSETDPVPSDEGEKMAVGGVR